MLGEQFTGVFTSVSAGLKTVKDQDGTKYKIHIYKVKLESADIDYPSMEKFNPYISQTLLQFQPIPFQGINFGEQSVYKMTMDLESENMDGAKSEASFGNVAIKKLSVKVVENIPVYIFEMEIPTPCDGKYLASCLKQKIEFTFNKEAK